MEVLFGRHRLQISENVWAGIEHFISTRGHIRTGEICAMFPQQNAELFAQAIHKVGGTL